jgi:Protein of unknown function (DUF2750)
MLQDHITVRHRHERFVKKVCETKIVFGLKNNEGFATSSSNEFDDEDGNPVQLICFWAESALANSCRKSGWENYELVELSLEEFIENWCVGLYNDGFLVGTSFDQKMFGYEAEPLDLILELIVELKSKQIGLELRKYTDIDELEEQVKEIVNG